MNDLSEMLALAGAAHQQGARAEAERLCRQVLARHPQHPAALERLALLALEAGQAAAAQGLFRDLVLSAGPSVSRYSNWAAACQLSGDIPGATLRLRQALALEPDSPELNQRLGSLYRGQQQFDRAAEHFKRALASNPTSAPAARELADVERTVAGLTGAADELERVPASSIAEHSRRALALIKAGRGKQAVAHFEAASRSEPMNAAWHLNLGNLCQMLGQTERAAEEHATAIRLDPKMRAYCAPSDQAQADEAGRRAHSLMRGGRPIAALDSALESIAWQPGNSRGLSLAGQLWHQLGNAALAKDFLLRASQAAPKSAEILNLLGNVWQELGQTEEGSRTYERAIEVDPNFAPAYRNLGYMLKEQGYMDEARRVFDQSQAIEHNDLIRILLATMLPPVYASHDELEETWARLERGVGELVSDGVSVDTTRVIVPTMFYCAYFGRNDRAVQEQMARVYQRPQQCEFKLRRRGVRPRVGFLSKYFRDHTIGRLNLGIVEQLSREKFEIVVIADRRNDPISQAFVRCAERFVDLPPDPAGAIKAICEQDLDLLFFADVGMDPLTYTLSFNRMAGVQCATWGHPVTTGSAAIDYFLSSELLEAPEGDAYYSEKLVRLPNLSNYYARPGLPASPRDRAALGLPGDRTLYGCPQTLFKMHPDMDALFGGILRADPRGELLLLEGKHPHWQEILEQRFARTLADVRDRIRFLPKLSHDDFLSFNALVDVLLDPTPFGGGNTSYEAFALGTPVVTWPTQMLRGRITLALYKKMGVLDAVVSSADEYIAKAVRLANDADYRREVREKILAASGSLFENRQAVAELEDFFSAAIRASRSG